MNCELKFKKITVEKLTEVIKNGFWCITDSTEGAKMYGKREILRSQGRDMGKVKNENL